MRWEFERVVHDAFCRVSEVAQGGVDVETQGDAEYRICERLEPFLHARCVLQVARLRESFLLA